MARHTPPRPVAVAELFPQLKPLGRQALRLHPRTGVPSYENSSFGGPLRWPADEPWPSCAEEHYAKDAADVRRVLASPPRSADAPQGHVPVPCVVHPEQVMEYPHGYEMPDDLHNTIDGQLDGLKEATGWDYYYHLSVAPGTKVGGYPNGLIAATRWFACERCGGPVEHLLSVRHEEFDGESWRTWLPVEDRPDDDGGPLYFRNHRFQRAAATKNPHGLEVGGGGDVYIFECRSCPDRPTQTLFHLN
ncbi:DUF1963 domain-containing protein [Nonomuraea purpurea]|uniref:DUF1963 domain-containing protein n=1 Tax=Nonomuraea purpurea TaxID=1849276 RepID=A0ABV8G3N4_9ACTN